MLQGRARVLMFRRTIASRPKIEACRPIFRAGRRVVPAQQIRNLKCAMDAMPYQLSFYVPKEHTSSVLAAVHKTGAGTFPGGIYGECAFISTGTGTFRPLQGSNPNIGSVGEVEKVEEDKVEMMCFGKQCVIDAVEALKKAHPYEQVAYLVVKGEDV